jgi:hypothetical protein
MLQVVGAEIDAVVVAVGATVCHKTPYVIQLEAVEWSEVFDDFALKDVL